MSRSDLGNLPITRSNLLSSPFDALHQEDRVHRRRDETSAPFVRRAIEFGHLVGKSHQPQLVDLSYSTYVAAGQSLFPNSTNARTILFPLIVDRLVIVVV